MWTWARGPRRPPSRPVKAMVRHPTELAYSTARSDVGRIAGAADGHQHVPGFGEVLQLLGENAFVGDVVGVGGDGGEAIGERHDAEAPRTAVAGAFDHVADEVRGGRGAAAVAADEDRAPRGAGLVEDLDGLRDHAGIDGLNSPQAAGGNARENRFPWPLASYYRASGPGRPPIFGLVGRDGYCRFSPAVTLAPA